MTDLPRAPDSSGDADEGNGMAPDGGSTTGMPRWVKVFLIIALVLVSAFVILRLTGMGGQHGPGRHMGPRGDGGTTSSSVADHRPPTGIPNHGG